jgi:hypothetical protein
MPYRLLVVAVTLALLPTAVGCRRSTSPSGTGGSAPDRPTSIVGNYEHGRWRIATRQELERTVLWVSHIVVLDREANRDGIPLLRPGHWDPDGTMPDRSRDEALARASAVAAQAAAHPEDFGKLAKEYSDDVVTKDAGGSMGGVRATQLPAEYLDALAAMRPGDVSRVIGTRYGFHVLMRRSPPADAMVAGERIVIRYRDTFGGRSGEPSARTRQAALDLARSVADRARGGADFGNLVRTYSENLDVAQSGDMGAWSVRDPGYVPRETEILQGLDIGGMSDPMDSPIGFEILRRTGAVERPAFAASRLEFRFDPALPDGARGSRPDALKTARSVQAAVAGDAAAFARYAREYCCADPIRWTQGRGEIGLGQAVERLKIGEIAAGPVEIGMAFLILKRIDASNLPSLPPVNYELPNPRGPDVEEMVKHGRGDILAERTRTLSREARKALALEPARAADLARVLEGAAASFEKSTGPNPEDARLQTFRDTMQTLRATLGPHDYAEFEAFRDAWLTGGIMAAHRL